MDKDLLERAGGRPGVIVALASRPGREYTAAVTNGVRHFTALGGTMTARSTPASFIIGTSFSMLNGSGSCGFKPGTHGQSGDAAFQRWTCASTINRLAAIAVVFC